MNKAVQIGRFLLRKVDDLSGWERLMFKKLNEDLKVEIPSAPSLGTNCRALTHTGDRCRIKRRDGSFFCWRHHHKFLSVLQTKVTRVQQVMEALERIGFGGGLERAFGLYFFTFPAGAPEDADEFSIRHHEIMHPKGKYWYMVYTSRLDRLRLWEWVSCGMRAYEWTYKKFSCYVCGREFSLAEIVGKTHGLCLTCNKWLCWKCQQTRRCRRRSKSHNVDHRRSDYERRLSQMRHQRKTKFQEQEGD